MGMVTCPMCKGYCRQDGYNLSFMPTWKMREYIQVGEIHVGIVAAGSLQVHFTQLTSKITVLALGRKKGLENPLRWTLMTLHPLLQPSKGPLSSGAALGYHGYTGFDPWATCIQLLRMATQTRRLDVPTNFCLWKSPTISEGTPQNYHNQSLKILNWTNLSLWSLSNCTSFLSINF